MQDPTASKPQTSLKGGRVSPVTTTCQQFIYIRVHQALLNPIQTSVANPLPPTGHLYLIEGVFEDIERYAGATVDWIIKVAHLICDPLGAGRLYTHTTGTSSDWYVLDRTSSWRQVVLGDPLLPGIYEFESSSPVLLSKISERHSHSVTSPGSGSSSATFGRCVRLRDGGCVVTGEENSIVAHLIPKRMGSDGVKAIMTTFSGEQAALDVQRFDPMIGIFLLRPLGTLVDCYQLGFYHLTGDTYALHNFSNPHLTALGMSSQLPLLANQALPPLHLYSVALSVHGGEAPLPPKGVFNWHYLQCVIHAFGSPNYKHFPDITFHVHPFKTASDFDDDEYTDNDETEPPYPSYCFDRFLAEQGRRQKILEDQEKIACWSSGVPSGFQEEGGGSPFT